MKQAFSILRASGVWRECKTHEFHAGTYLQLADNLPTARGVCTSEVGTR